MTEAWLKQPEQGSELFIRFLAHTGRLVGWHIGRSITCVVGTYYASITRPARMASRDYLSTVLGRKATLLQVFRHIVTFAYTIQDRIFFLTGNYGRYEINVHGAELFADLKERGQGAVLLGSHLGSFEVLRALGINDHDLPIKVLMYPNNSRRFIAVQNSLNARLAGTIIPIGTPESMLQVKEHVDHGGMIGILGDRSVEGEKAAKVTFLGRPAQIPVGPYLLASALKVPVILFFGLHRGGRRYDVHFELLTDCMSLDRRARDEELRKWAKHFAGRLEHYCRLAPYNWFNFFDFWRKDHAG